MGKGMRLGSEDSQGIRQWVKYAGHEQATSSLERGCNEFSSELQRDDVT